MLPHSIFQTEVQFNAPTPGNHPAGSNYQTNHSTGNITLSDLDKTYMINKSPSGYSVGEAYQTYPVAPGYESTGYRPQSGQKVWETNQPKGLTHLSTLDNAKEWVEERNAYWIDKASGKVRDVQGPQPKPKSKKKSKKKRSWRSRLKTLRRRFKW